MTGRGKPEQKELQSGGEERATSSRWVGLLRSDMAMAWQKPRRTLSFGRFIKLLGWNIQAVVLCRGKQNGIYRPRQALACWKQDRTDGKGVSEKWLNVYNNAFRR